MNGEFLRNNPEIGSEPSVDDASLGDIEGILAIQSERVTVPEDATEGQELGESGFLVYPLSGEELKQVIEDRENHVVKVAREGDKVVGYVISYDLSRWETTRPDWFSRLNVPEEDKTILSDEKVLYGRHIATYESTKAAGVGKKLIDSTLQEASNRGYGYFVAEVMKKPVTNHRSLAFVQKEGFRSIGEIADKNDRSWFVLLKDLTEQHTEQ